jgi:DnaJ-class molecular chaperone
MNKPIEVLEAIEHALLITCPTCHGTTGPDVRVYQDGTCATCFGRGFIRVIEEGENVGDGDSQNTSAAEPK